PGYRRRPRARTRRRRHLQRLHAASLGGQPVVAVAAAALSELQRAQRRRRATRAALRGIPHVASGALRRIRQDGHVLPMSGTPGATIVATTGATEVSRRPFAWAGWINVVVGAVIMLATFPGRTQGLGLITEPMLRDLQLDHVTYANINL